MRKQYLIFDLDGTLIESMHDSEKIVFRYLSQLPNFNEERARYIYNNTMWTPLLRQLEMICEWIDVDVQNLCDKIYSDIYELDCHFFPWVPEKIQELSMTYQLFLTTGNSTPTAEKYLKNGKIFNSFELILGSNEILKWWAHLELFKEYSNDANFYEKSIYVGDGGSDREFALEKWIDFIHIWNAWYDQYEIPSVLHINSILTTINS